LTVNPGAATAPRAARWPQAAAVVSAILGVTYLAVWGRRYGLDLMVYRDAVDSWASGRNVYSLNFTASRLPFTYPPFALPVLSPLAWLSFPVTQWLLWALSIGATAVSVVLVVRAGGVSVTPRVWYLAVAWSFLCLLGLEPARSGADYGQIEFILMFLVVADLLAVPPRYCGVLLGVAAAVKLTPLVFIVVLAASRDLRSVIRAAASFGVWTALGWLLWPGESRTYWLHDILQPGRIGSITYAGNQSWYAILHRPPFPASGSALVWALVCLLIVAAAAVVAWRCAGTGEHAFGIIAVALAGLLASPISWSHHWVWLVLLPPVLVFRRGPAVPRVIRTLLWGLVALAVAAPYWWVSHGAGADVAEAIMPLWASATLLAWSVIELRRRRQAAAPQLASREKAGQLS
jgi:alpha-1,2-mannosyltransferase